MMGCADAPAERTSDKKENRCMRRTKIVATLGPATDSAERILELITAGVNVIRLNFSHGVHSEHQRRIELVRAAAAQAKQPVAILLDLQGPKIRTGKLQNDSAVELTDGQQFVITTQDILGNAQRVSTTYQALPTDVRIGDRILLSDGLIELVVKETSATEVITTVVNGGELRQRQGINLPGVNVSAPALSEKDVDDLHFGLAHDVDYVAISFVRRPEDVAQLRDLIARSGKPTPIIAKIEKPEAIDRLPEIIAAVDGVMVARGDLGVEMRPEQVPLIQKRIIKLANEQHKPVITATQMLESMIHNPRPTRAEASDVANAILDGTDAVMLSGETAVGEFPIETVKMMARIAEEAEHGLRMADLDDPSEQPMMIDAASMAGAIAEAACAITRAVDVKAIIAFTQSGNTTRLVSSNRPQVAVIGATPNERVWRQMSLLWGVTPVMVPQVERLDDLSDLVKERILEYGIVQPGDSIVMTGGHPLPVGTATNLLKVMEV
jgi:pyruvate kinase